MSQYRQPNQFCSNIIEPGVPCDTWTRIPQNPCPRCGSLPPFRTYVPLQAQQVQTQYRPQQPVSLAYVSVYQQPTPNYGSTQPNPYGYTAAAYGSGAPYAQPTQTASQQDYIGPSPSYVPTSVPSLPYMSLPIPPPVPAPAHGQMGPSGPFTNYLLPSHQYRGYGRGSSFVAGTPPVASYPGGQYGNMYCSPFPQYPQMQEQLNAGQVQVVQASDAISYISPVPTMSSNSTVPLSIAHTVEGPPQSLQDIPFPSSNIPLQCSSTTVSLGPEAGTYIASTNASVLTSQPGSSVGPSSLVSLPFQSGQMPVAKCGQLTRTASSASMKDRSSRLENVPSQIIGTISKSKRRNNKKKNGVVTPQATASAEARASQTGESQVEVSETEAETAPAELRTQPLRLTNSDTTIISSPEVEVASEMSTRLLSSATLIHPDCISPRRSEAWTAMEEFRMIPETVLTNLPSQPSMPDPPCSARNLIAFPEDHCPRTFYAIGEWRVTPWPAGESMVVCENCNENHPSDICDVAPYIIEVYVHKYSGVFDSQCRRCIDEPEHKRNSHYTEDHGRCEWRHHPECLHLIPDHYAEYKRPWKEFTRLKPLPLLFYMPWYPRGLLTGQDLTPDERRRAISQAAMSQSTGAYETEARFILSDWPLYELPREYRRDGIACGLWDPEQKKTDVLSSAVAFVEARSELKETFGYTYRGNKSRDRNRRVLGYGCVIHHSCLPNPKYRAGICSWFPDAFVEAMNKCVHPTDVATLNHLKTSYGYWKDQRETIDGNTTETERSEICCSISKAVHQAWEIYSIYLPYWSPQEPWEVPEPLRNILHVRFLTNS